MVSQKKFNGVLNCVSGNSYRYTDIIKILNKHLNKHIKIKSKKRSKEKTNNFFSPFNINKELVDFKFTSLNYGMQELINQFKQTNI